FPNIAVDKNDNIYVASSECNGSCRTINGIDLNKTDVKVVKSTNRGQSFGTPVNVSKNQFSSLMPYLILDGRGNVNVAWQDATPDEETFNDDILFSRSTDGGATFSTPENLSFNHGVSVGAAGAADSNGNLMVAWSDDSTANPEIFVAPLVFF